jgi:hypothetical protein
LLQSVLSPDNGLEDNEKELCCECIFLIHNNLLSVLVNFSPKAKNLRISLEQFRYCYGYSGMSGSSQLTPNGLDLATESHQQVIVSLPDDILENYKEAVINYSKVWLWTECVFICHS